MFNFLALIKYHDTIMAVVRFIEATVPDDLPGTKKLDMALKVLIKADAKLAKLVPEVTTLIGLAKSVVNQAKAITEEAAGGGA